MISNIKWCATIIATIATTTLTLSGCLEVGEDSAKDVSPTGVSLFMEANIPLGETVVQVAAAVYENDLPAPLTGGDVLVARTESEEKVLLVSAEKDSYYQNTLIMTNPDTEVELEVIFDPQGTRSDRWYPTEELLVDPGPGSVVGYQASMTFPESVEITEPLPNTTYTSRSDEINMQWLGAPSNDLVIVSHNRCYFKDTDNDASWVYIESITDDQSHALILGDIIPDKDIIETTLNTDDALTAFISLIFSPFFEVITFGTYESEEIIIQANKLEYCTLTMSLVRQKEGTLGEGVSGGSVVGSRSDKVTLEYRP